MYSGVGALYSGVGIGVEVGVGVDVEVILVVEVEDPYSCLGGGEEGGGTA